MASPSRGPIVRSYKNGVGIFVFPQYTIIAMKNSFASRRTIYIFSMIPSINVFLSDRHRRCTKQCVGVEQIQSAVYEASLSLSLSLSLPLIQRRLTF
jgi:hypothetical protein